MLSTAKVPVLLWKTCSQVLHLAHTLQSHQILPGHVEVSLLDEVVQPSEGSIIPARVAVIKMLLLINRVVAGCTIWEVLAQCQQL